MSDPLVYPCLILNRKFASNGRPYWLAELRFDESDTEVRDIDVISKEDAVAVCLEKWSDLITRVGDVWMSDHMLENSPGQYIYRVTLHPEVRV